MLSWMEMGALRDYLQKLANQPVLAQQLCCWKKKDRLEKDRVGKERGTDNKIILVIH